MNNEDESVHCDQDDGERREEDAACLGGPDQLAEVLHVLAQGPILATRGNRKRNARKRNGMVEEEQQEEIGRGMQYFQIEGKTLLQLCILQY